MPEARQIGLEGGGWFSFALFKYDDPPSRRFRTLRQYQLRLWGSANIQGVHRFYVRGMLGWDDWNSGDNPDDPTGSGSDYDYQEVERAWYQLDLGQLMKNQTGKTPPVGFRFKVGRAFTELGTALTLSMPLDLLQFEVTAGDLDFRTFLAMTIRDTRNIDDSNAVWDDNNRCMWGTEIKYTGFDRHRPFVYYLLQEDHINPDPDDSLQNYDYSTQYLGIGSEGTVLLPGLRYQTELVGEWGKTFSDGVTDNHQDNVYAMAYDLLLEYFFRVKTRPKVMAEYLWASGDSDRTRSATATVGGNVVNTTDHAFNAFGFRDTGIAFSPRVSNLHMYMVGGSFFPLEHMKLFKKLEVGTKVFFYHKAADGAISDTSGSVNNSRWLGWEWDVYCNWRITSDLAWTIRYGAFCPGAAFEIDDLRNFLYTAVTFSF